MAIREVIAADLTLTGDHFERNVHVAVDDDGHIASVERASQNPVTRRLSGMALLPGFVNAHSHAFQRGLRGLGETFPERAGSFWTWREEMYRLVEQMTSDRMYTLCLQAFSEMRDAGITTVGEFHYLHHLPASEQFELDYAVLAAARDVGIRIVLLQAFYKTGGIGMPLKGGQRQFATHTLDAYWQQFDQLASQVDTSSQTLGVVAHSIRAADIEDIARLHEESRSRRLPFHMHVEEQPAEIEACIAHYGKPPMRALLDRLTIDERFTAVHCTHTALEDMQGSCAAGGNICICPLTEANLGDGLADIPVISAAGGRLCLGTDSNARISMLEEMRWLEYGQRLRFQRRGVIRHGQRWDIPVFAAGTSGGAASLGVNVGRIEPGLFADLVAVDLGHPSLADATDASLLAALLSGAPDSVIAGTAVGGNWQGFEGIAGSPK